MHFNLPKIVSGITYIAIICTFTGECDFEVAVHKATFKAGSTRTTLRLNIIDDDIYEGPELFNFAILPATSNNAVTRCSTRFRGSVTIVDDEPSKQSVTN